MELADTIPQQRHQLKEKIRHLEMATIFAENRIVIIPPELVELCSDFSFRLSFDTLYFIKDRINKEIALLKAQLDALPK